MRAISLRAGFSRCRFYTLMLLGYAEGQLDSRQSARVEAHLASCAACQSELATIREVARVLSAQRESFAPVNTVLWERIEAEIQRSPQISGRPGAPSFWAPSRRVSIFGDSPWGQALPFAATAFAAIILVAALVKSPQSPIAPSIAEVKAPKYAVSPVSPMPLAAANSKAPARSSGTLVAAAGKLTAPISHGHSRSEESGANVTLTHIPRIYPEPQSASAIVSSNVARRRATIDSRLLSTRSGGDHEPMIADAATPPKTAEESVGPAIRPTLGPGNPSATASLGGAHAAVTYVASNLPSHGAYAADDESDASLSVADVSRSVRRQQDLFSYTNR